MNTNGKRARQMTGRNRHEIKFANHAHKSPAKIKRARWTRHPNGVKHEH